MRKYLPLVIIPFILLIVFTLLSNASAKPYSLVYNENSVWDMRNFDFSSSNALLGGYAAIIPDTLLSPEEFAARESEAFVGDPRAISYLTSRLIVLVPEDGWYTFTRLSIPYSQRLYVNGKLMLEVGQPSADPHTARAATARIMFTAQAVEGVIEIVQQSSNHMHRRSGLHHNWYMGAGNAIINEVRTSDIQNAILYMRICQAKKLF